MKNIKWEIGEAANELLRMRSLVAITQSNYYYGPTTVADLATTYESGRVLEIDQLYYLELDTLNLKSEIRNQIAIICGTDPDEEYEEYDRDG